MMRYTAPPVDFLHRINHTARYRMNLYPKCQSTSRTL